MFETWCLSTVPPDSNLKTIWTFFHGKTVVDALRLSNQARTNSAYATCIKPEDCTYMRILHCAIKQWNDKFHAKHQNHIHKYIIDLNLTREERSIDRCIFVLHIINVKYQWIRTVRCPNRDFLSLRMFLFRSWIDSDYMIVSQSQFAKWPCK